MELAAPGYPGEYGWSPCFASFNKFLPKKCALALGNSLSAVSTLGNVSVGSLATRTSHVEIGAAPVAVGSTVGTITITTGDLAILAGGLLANTQYQFNFDTYAANPVVTAGGGAVTPTASGAWAVGVGTGSNAAGGVAFITV